MATSFTRAWNSAVLATKSVSQLISTSTPILPPGWMYAPTRPSQAARPAFLAAAARPFLRRISRALWASPLASTSADLHSIMPAPVSSRSLRTISAEILMRNSSMNAMNRHENREDGPATVPWRSTPPSGRGGGGGGGPGLGPAHLAPFAARRRRLRRPRLAEAPSGPHRVRHSAGEEAYGAQGVVVPRYHHVHLVGVAVRVHHAHHRDPQLAGLGHRDRLLAGIDHEDGVRHRLHGLDALEVSLELAPLFFEVGDLLLGQPLVAPVRGHGLQLLQAVQALAHGDEVGEEPAQPGLIHIRHPAPRGSLRDGLLRLALGADEEEGLALGGRILHGLQGLAQHAGGLPEVDETDALALPEDKVLHLRVPAAGL